VSSGNRALSSTALARLLRSCGSGRTPQSGLDELNPGAVTMRTITERQGPSALSIRKVLPLVLVLAACGADSDAHEASEGESASRATEGRSTSRAAVVPMIPAGAELVFEVLEDVSTATHRSGDAFRLRLVQPVSGSHGAQLVAGAEARGVVTESRPSSGPDQESLLGLSLTTMQVNGGHRPIEATVESASMQQAAGDSGERTAAKIATGAAAGAIVGQILGRNTRSTVVGAAVGAAAGTGIALSTRTGHAVLPRGSLVTVRLTEPLVVN
jgi:hypothetical protein